MSKLNVLFNEVRNVETSRSFVKPLRFWLTFGQFGIWKLRHCFVPYWREEGRGGEEGGGGEGKKRSRQRRSTSHWTWA